MSDERCLGFVLSAGRTGTVWLAKTLSEQFPDICFEHEPSPSRTELMLANLRNDWGLGRGILQRFFRSVRRKRYARLPEGNRYVEVNPMLCALTDLLPELEVPLRVVHVVRDPRSWCKSILKFKASGLRKLVIDYVPFATPYPSPRPAGWRRMDAKQKALWRWQYCNERILEVKPRCESYCLIRHEDLFSDHRATRQAAMQTILETLTIDFDDLDWLDVSERVNASGPAEDTKLDEANVEDICGALLDQFNYRQPTSAGQG